MKMKPRQQKRKASQSKSWLVRWYRRHKLIAVCTIIIILDLSIGSIIYMNADVNGDKDFRAAQSRCGGDPIVEYPSFAASGTTYGTPESSFYIHGHGLTYICREQWETMKQNMNPRYIH